MLRKNRKTLTLKDKMAILSMLDSGESMNDIAQQFEIGRTTVYEIKIRRLKIMAYANISDERKRLRRGKYPETEAALYAWFLEERAKDTPITSDILREKSKEIHFSLTGQEFQASNGWFEKFKKRYSIHLYPSTVGEQRCLKTQDERIIDDFVKTFKEKVDQLGLVQEQLYSADVSSLLWRAMIKAENEDTREDKSKTKDIITFMPCSNATGTHKLDLLVIAKDNTEELDKTTLTVSYKQHTNSWLTKEIFIEWFHDEFVPAVRTFMSAHSLPEKAILVVDEAPGYPEEHFLKSNDWMIQVLFLPANYSHMIQPMDHHLMENIKKRFRKNLLFDNISKRGDIRVNLKGLKLINALHFLSDSWNGLPVNVIKNTWKKLLPNIELITHDDDDDGISERQLVEAFWGTGIGENDVRDWLSGKVDMIIEKSDGKMENQAMEEGTTSEEDPLCSVVKIEEKE